MDDTELRKLVYGDIVVDPLGGNRTGVVIQVGEKMVRVEFADDTTGFYAPEPDTRLLPELVLCPISIHLMMSDWARLPDLCRYTQLRDIPVDEAIRELVNAGLSHQLRESE